MTGPQPGTPRRAPRVPPNSEYEGRGGALHTRESLPHPHAPLRAPSMPEGMTLSPPPAPPAAPPPVAPRAAPVVERVSEDETPRADPEPVLDARYEKVALPSRFVVYPWLSLSVRTVEPFDQAKITRAVRKQNLTVTLDALSTMMTRDARELCVGDFYSIAHWHRHNSYPRNNTQITWASRYGGRHTAGPRRTELVTRELRRSREEYVEWQARGLSIPTMRDVEALESLGDEELGTLFEHAQYITLTPELTARAEVLRAAGNTMPAVTARVEELQRRGMAFYALVEEFNDAFADFGVDEYAYVTVPAREFDPRAAVKSLRTLRLDDGQPDHEALAEALEIERALADNKAPQPREERVPVTFRLWDMFPYV